MPRRAHGMLRNVRAPPPTAGRASCGPPRDTGFLHRQSSELLEEDEESAPAGTPHQRPNITLDGDDDDSGGGGEVPLQKLLDVLSRSLTDTFQCVLSYVCTRRCLLSVRALSIHPFLTFLEYFSSFTSFILLSDLIGVKFINCCLPPCISK